MEITKDYPENLGQLKYLLTIKDNKVYIYIDIVSTNTGQARSIFSWFDPSGISGTRHY